MLINSFRVATINSFRDSSSDVFFINICVGGSYLSRRQNREKRLSIIWHSRFGYDTLALCSGFEPNNVVFLTDDLNTVSAGQVLSFENLVYSIFDFVTVLVETPKFRNSVKQGLDDLVYYVIVYGQITEDQVRRSQPRAEGACPWRFSLRLQLSAVSRLSFASP